jgi:hypothetical protein
MRKKELETRIASLERALELSSAANKVWRELYEATVIQPVENITLYGATYDKWVGGKYGTEQAFNVGNIDRIAIKPDLDNGNDYFKVLVNDYVLMDKLTLEQADDVYDKFIQSVAILKDNDDGGSFPVESETKTNG